MFEQKPASQNTKLRVSIDYRIITIILLVALLACVVIWKPWSKSSVTRSITVTGESTVKATPDEYMLSPYFEFTGADRVKAASDQATKITAKLKELGVKDTEISSNTNSYQKYSINGADSEDSLQLSYTITPSGKDTAQKVQDYLLELNAKGQISPVATFSKTKQKELEASAREEAIADAKSKAEKTAKETGAKLGKVITVSDGGNGGIIQPLSYGSGASIAEDTKAVSSIPVQTGQNEFNASVEVKYELR